MRKVFYRRKQVNQSRPFTEQSEQEQVARHIERNYPDILWTASCGGMRTSLGTAMKMKRAGYRKGCPDIYIFERRGESIGLMIELKRPEIKGICKKGIPSHEQLEFLKKAMMLGWLTAICYGAQEAESVIDRYFQQSELK